MRQIACWIWGLSLRSERSWSKQTCLLGGQDKQCCLKSNNPSQTMLSQTNLFGNDWKFDGRCTFYLKVLSLLMGCAASHIMLECALQTHPTITIIGEEVSAQKQTLKGVTDYITNIICKRADAGYNYGIILIPEGLIDFILELLIELNGADQRQGVYIIGATNRPEVMDQAAAHGLPMVATKNGGPVDIHRVLDNGLLIDPHDEQSVADALLKLVADKQLWSKCRSNGLRNIHLFS